MRCLLLAPVALATSWWQEAKIYRVLVPSFQDSNGDGVGDLKGLISKLSYVHDTLGYDALIVSPVFEAVNTTDEWHDISNFTNVDPIFGTLDDFDSLVTKCHGLSLKLILEWVPNHSSKQHPWFQQAIADNATDDQKSMYTWKPDKVSTPNWVSYYGTQASSAFSSEGGAQYYHAFADSEPDLNYLNPAVVKGMEDALEFWVKRGIDGVLVTTAEFLHEATTGANAWQDETLASCNPGCDGFQLFDQTSHTQTQHQTANHQVFAGWRKVLDKYSDRVMMADLISEVSQDVQAAYLGTDSVPEFHCVVTPYLDRPWSKLTELVSIVQNTTSKGAVGNTWVWKLGGPRAPRLMTRVGNDANTSIAATTLVKLLPGATISYYGNEILMQTADVPQSECHDPRCIASGSSSVTDGSRTPMQWMSKANAGFSTNSTTWLPVPDNVSATVDAGGTTDSGRARHAAATVNQYLASKGGYASPTSRIFFVQIQGSPVLVASFDPDASGQNTTTVVVNYGTDATKLNWDDVTSRLNLQKDTGALQWEVRYSTYGQRTPGTLLEEGQPILLQPLEVISISWWLYGTQGVMDTAHTVYFALLICTNIMQMLTVIGVLFYTCRGLKNRSNPLAGHPCSQLPRISVVIPCYMPNEEPIIMDTVNHALNSILYEVPRAGGSLPPDFESKVTVYVVYNGPPSWSHSIENTLEAMNNTRYGPYNRLFRVMRVHDSRSKAQNLNHVINLINDPYTIIYDADHHPDPLSLRISMNLLLSRNLDCVQGSTYIREGPMFLGNLVNAEFFVTYFLAFPAMQVIGQTAFFGGSNAVWRTSFLKAQQFDHTAQTEDIEFSVRAMLKRAKIEFCPESRSGELAPATFGSLYKQRLRWAMGWDQVTFMHMKAISKSKELSCCRKCGMFYILPARWATLFFSWVAVVSGTFVSVWWYFYNAFVRPDRYTTWGTPINISNTISISFVFFTLAWTTILACTLERRIANKFKLSLFVVVFIILGPGYILFQTVLVATSMFRLSTGKVGGWVVTARQGGVTAPMVAGDTEEADPGQQSVQPGQFRFACPDDEPGVETSPKRRSHVSSSSGGFEMRQYGRMKSDKGNELGAVLLTHGQEASV